VACCLASWWIAGSAQVTLGLNRGGGPGAGGKLLHVPLVHKPLSGGRK
jgi:hypothetical protein